MHKIRKWIRRNFGFTQRETSGFLVLLLLTAMGILLPFLFYNQPATYNPAQDQADLDSLVALLDARTPNREYTSKYPEKIINNSVPVKPLNRFDPNKLSQQEWQELGVSRYAAGNIVKYRAKAGGFTYKEQIQRIYGLPSDLYLKLEPFMDLPSKNEKPTYPDKYAANRPNTNFPDRPEYKSTKTTYRLQPFDINTTDTTQLKRIRGIGSKLSARIIAFRNKVGGFNSTAQLKEVYGLPPEIIDSLHKYTFVAPAFAPAQVNINTATLEELRAHPYIGFTVARLLISYRTQHGPYQNLDQLKNIKVLDEQRIQKLKPYLRL